MVATGTRDTRVEWTGGTTTGLGRTGETETGQAKLPDEAGPEPTTELDTGRAILPDEAGRETTTELGTELGAPTKLELDTTAGTATGLETTDDTAKLDGATALERARQPNGAELDTTEQADTVDEQTATGLVVTGGATAQERGRERAGLRWTLQEWTSAKLERAALTIAKPHVDSPNVCGTQDAIYIS